MTMAFLQSSADGEHLAAAPIDIDANIVAPTVDAGDAIGPARLRDGIDLTNALAAGDAHGFPFAEAVGPYCPFVTPIDPLLANILVRHQADAIPADLDALSEGRHG